MRYVPSTRVGSLVMAAVRHTAKTGDAHPDLAKEVMATTLRCIEQHEQRLSPNAGFVKVDDQMSKLFLDWACALEAGDGHRASELEEMLDQTARDHPFDYAQSKREFYRHFTCSTYYEAKKTYRKWDEVDKDFAVVRSKVSGTGKIAVIGDWGTGEDDANALFAAVMGHKPDVILHLGDIYEAGLPIEVEEHFLKPINDICGNNRPPIFTIPGNHEYFSGAKGYFELIDVLNGGKDSDWNQEASFFCLRSDDEKYQFIGADSGLGCLKHSSCPPLLESEIKWHRDRIKEFPGKTIFMTHHQFITIDYKINWQKHHNVDGERVYYPSDYGYFNGNFVDAFNHVIPNSTGSTETYLDRIDLWLWGHAHWFVSFKENTKIPISHGHDLPKLKRGQLLGGSARENTRGNAKMRYEVRKWVTQTGDVTKDGKKGTGPLVAPGATNADRHGRMLYNHTYGIMDLATGKVSYYQTPAWTAGSRNPTKSPDACPIMTVPI